MEILPENDLKPVETQMEPQKSKKKDKNRNGRSIPVGDVVIDGTGVIEPPPFPPQQILPYYKQRQNLKAPPARETKTEQIYTEFADKYNTKVVNELRQIPVVQPCRTFKQCINASLTIDDLTVNKLDSSNYGVRKVWEPVGAKVANLKKIFEQTNKQVQEIKAAYEQMQRQRQEQKQAQTQPTQQQDKGE